jgi:hypothetical protein
LVHLNIQEQSSKTRRLQCCTSRDFSNNAELPPARAVFIVDAADAVPKALTTLFTERGRHLDALLHDHAGPLVDEILPDDIDRVVHRIGRRGIVGRLVEHDGHRGTFPGAGSQ